MIQRILRPFWYPLLVALLIGSAFQLEWFLSLGAGDLGLENAAGLEAAGANDDSISIGGLIKDTCDPWVFAFAALVTLIFGRAKGLASGFRFAFGVLGSERAPIRDADQARRFMGASRTLAAGGRALLWGSLAINAYYVSRLPWASDASFQGFIGWEQFRYVHVSSLTILPLVCLYLLPLAKRARSLGQSHSGEPDLACSSSFATLDRLVSLALLVLSFIPHLVEFRARLISDAGESTFRYLMHRPVIEGVSQGLVLWSLAFVIVLTCFAFLPTVGRLKREGAWHQFGHLAFISGALGVFIVFNNGLAEWARNGGGQLDYPFMQRLAGQSFTPLFVGLLIFLVTRFIGRSKTNSV